MLDPVSFLVGLGTGLGIGLLAVAVVTKVTIHALERAINKYERKEDELFRPTI